MVADSKIPCMHQSDVGGVSENQAERTGRDLLDSVEARFGRIMLDLAAENAEVSVADRFISPEQDSLASPWPIKGLLWLNPPFKRIGPWAQKCREWATTAQPGARLLFLVPASVDSVWWHENVRGYARVLSLRPRLTFRGHRTPFPKPMALCVYDPSWPNTPPSVEDWAWKRELEAGQLCLVRNRPETFRLISDMGPVGNRGSQVWQVAVDDGAPGVFEAVEAADIIHVVQPIAETNLYGGDINLVGTGVSQ